MLHLYIHTAVLYVYTFAVASLGDKDVFFDIVYNDFLLPWLKGGDVSLFAS